ncbi:MAG: pyridoxal phosphate-dependent aminotransferase [Deltaproteobacteria bacterium]|nr:pyridoxal phosphate-dependent aminotransferase [Deltaproteobacteria bacterium]
MKQILKSQKLENVVYDIRGPILKEAQKLEQEGYKILKMNIGNPAPFGFEAPEEVIHDMILNLPNAQGYSDSKGIFPARKAIMQYYQSKGIMDVEIEDIFLGNGVSELICIAMQALLNSGDEMLIPSPDYPLWTAAVTLSGGKPVHYMCDEASDWQPDINDIRSKITDKTKGIVVINPNNPTGAVYCKEILEQIVKLAVEKELIIFADEIYEKIIYDDARHVNMAALTDEALIVTFNGLSKAYRAAGYRSGWMMFNGKKSIATDFIEGVALLASMRLCSNVPAQYAIQTSLGGYQSINDLIIPGGRLYEQRNYLYERIVSIPGISCVKPRGAMYMFPKIDTARFNISNDQQFVLDFLRQEHVLIVGGSGFNWSSCDHFRLVFLPPVDYLQKVIERFERFLTDYRQQ